MVTTSVLRFCHMRCDEDVILAWIPTAQSGNSALGVRSWVLEFISICPPDWTWGRGHPTPPVVSALLQDVGNQALVFLQSFHTVVIIILGFLGTVLDSCT